MHLTKYFIAHMQENLPSQRCEKPFSCNNDLFSFVLKKKLYSLRSFLIAFSEFETIFLSGNKCAQFLITGSTF